MTDTELDPCTTQPEKTPAKAGSASWFTGFFKKSTETGANGKPKKTWKQELGEWFLTLLVALVVAFVLRSFVFEPVVVDGDSMYPTLHHGEIMYVSKTSYGTSFFGIPFTGIGNYFTVGGNPERFDVVVCHFPDRLDSKTGARINFVKRVIGLPGDRVQIKDGYLYVNGVKYEEKFLHERMLSDWPNYQFSVKYSTTTDGSYIVPEGHYLVMGDNRNSSNDSRSWAVGPIPRDMIVGRVDAVLWHKIPGTLEDSGFKPYK